MTAQAIIFALPASDKLDALWPDGKIRIGDATLPIQNSLHRQRFTGTHDPIGIWIAAGGPIAARDLRGRLSVLDIAPLLFYAAGQPIPDDLEGSLNEAWIRPELWLANPPRSAPARSAALPVASDAAADRQDPALLEKLRALGYLE